MQSFVALSSLTATAHAFGQDNDETTTRAEEIVVTGRGMPDSPGTLAYSTLDLDRERLVSSASGRLEDVLSSVAGFQQFRRSDSRSSNPSAQGVTLRALGGNATSRAVIMLDGVPLADPLFGAVPFSALPPEGLAFARVTRGAGAGPFGPGALAGVIELVSAEPEAGAQTSLLVNDRGDTEAGASLTSQLGRSFVASNVRWDRGDGFHTTPEDQRVASTARASFESVSGQVRLVAPLTDTVELQARALAFDDRRTLRFDGADSTSSGLDASLRLVGRGEWPFDAIAYFQSRDFSNVVISATQFVRVLDQRSTPSTGIGGKFELRPPLDNDHVLRIGADYRRSHGRLFEDSYSAVTGQLTTSTEAGGTNHNLGFFIEDDWRVDRLTLTFGGRLDRSIIGEGFVLRASPTGTIIEDERFPDRSNWTPSFRGGVLYRASDTIDLRAAAYSSLRLPTLNELYRSFVVFPVTTQANAALRNERLGGFEAGLDWRLTRDVAISLTAFDNRVEDAIANVTLAANLRERRNIDAIEARGLEMGLTGDLGDVSFDWSTAYTDAEVRGLGAAATLDGFRPAQAPRWTASATVAWSPQADWRFAATVRYVGDQFEDDLERDRLPPATTLGGFAQIPLNGRVALIIRGENLLGEEIVTRNAGGSIDLGAPRTIWAGLRYGY